MKTLIIFALLAAAIFSTSGFLTAQYGPPPYIEAAGSILPYTHCLICPYDQNQGRPLRYYIDSYTGQYVWEYSCWQNHIWRCYANPQKLGLE